MNRFGKFGKVIKGLDANAGFRTNLARIKRTLLAKPHAKDPSFPTFWIGRRFGQQTIQCIQIGSNDGVLGDPLHQILLKNEQWRALFVEPIPYYFEELKRNYGNSERFKFENAAITIQMEQKFYMVSRAARKDLPDLPYWCEQLGSFDRDHIEKQYDGKLRPYIEELNVQCLTLNELLERHGIEGFEVLHIDAEGHDWIILQQLKTLPFRPAFILFEKVHLSESDLTAAANFLYPDYHLFDVGLDLFAAHRQKNEELILEMNKYMQLQSH